MDLNLSIDDCLPVEIPFEYMGEKYILCDADGETAARYKNARMASYTYVDGKVASINGLANVQAILVGGCVVRESDRKQVGESVVSKWKEKLLSKLFDKAMEISGLRKEEGTVESLKKQREDLDKQIRDMENAEAESKKS